MWEWEARTKSQPNLQELTDTVNAFIQGYAEHFEVETSNGTLSATASDKADSDEKMRLVYSTLLSNKQGYVDGRFSVSDRVACAGIVDRDVAVGSNSTQRCGVLEITNSEYHAQPTFGLEDVDAIDLPPSCSGVGQQCVYTCYPEHHLVGRDVLENVGVATCLETGEYADALPCVLTEEPVLMWWRNAKEPLGVEVFVLGGGLFAVFIVLCCSLKRRVRRETSIKPHERDRLHSDINHHSILARRISSEVSREGPASRRGHRSLLRNKNLLLVARVCVPLLLALNVFFFVGGHTLPMMSVDIDVKFLGREIKIGLPAFDTLVSRANGISLGEVVVLLVESPEVPWSMLIMVGGFSGVWPYAQLALLSFAWVLPPARLRPKTRGQWLLVISQLGKWSFIYLYVSVLIMLALSVTVGSPDLGVFPPGLWHVDVKFMAGYGLFGFTLASIFAVLVANIALYCHFNALTREHSANLARNRVRLQVGSLAKFSTASLKQPTSSNKSYSKLEDDDSVEVAHAGLAREESAAAADQMSWFDIGTLDVLGVRSSLVYSREALSSHVFVLEKYEIWFGGGGRLVIVLLIITSMACTFAGGFVIHCFGVRFYGVGAAPMAFGDPASINRDYTIFGSFLSLMAHHEDDPTENRVRVAVLACTYLVGAVVVPLIQAVVMLGLWVVPLTLQSQKRFFFSAGILQSWNMLSVFLAAFAVTSTALHMVANSMSDSIAPDLLRQMRELGLITVEDQNAGLLRVEMASDYYGIYLLLVGWLCEYFAATVVLRSAEVAIDERDWRISGRPPDEEQEMGCGKPMMNQLLRGTTCCLIPVTPGLAYMPRWFVRRHNLSKLLRKYTGNLPFLVNSGFV